MHPALAVDAVYVLHDIIPLDNKYNCEMDIPVISRYTGECCMSRIIRIDNQEQHYALYININKLSNIHKKTSAIIGALISGNSRAALTPANHNDFYDAKRFENVRINHSIDINYVIDTVMQLPISRVTADHHQNITHNEMYAMFNTSRKKQHFNFKILLIQILLNRMNELRIDNRVSMTTYITYILVAPFFAVVHLSKIVAESKSADEFETILKWESVAAKQSQTMWRDDLAAIYELNTLRNRVYEKVDWEKEYDHRVNPNVVNMPYEVVYKEALSIFRDARLEGKKPLQFKWADYWAIRWSRLPGGSVVSQYPEDIELKKQLKLEARIKSAWFSAISDNSQNKWLEREPGIYATTSTKYEWGKVRALYGCDVTSFIHSDFAMSNCEDVLPSYFPVGKYATEENVNRSMKKFDETIPVCFDYDDFNSQHSISSMQAVLSAWKECFKLSLTDEQNLSLQWTIDSVANMRVRFNELKTDAFINGTLMSGWRLTSFMNTVLNRVYLKVAHLDKLAVYALHNGDDVFAGCRNVGEANSMVRAALNAGIRAQMAKTNIGTIGEFLRIDTRSKNPKGKQYLARSVATAVHGRVETSAPNDLLALVRANDVRLDSIIDRGGDVDVVGAVAKQLTKFAAKLFNVGIEVVEAARMLHPIQGGFDEQAELFERRLIRKTDVTSNAQLDEYCLVKPGIYDYIEHVMNKFGLSRESISKRKLFRTAISSMLRDKVSYEIVVEDRWNVVNYRAIYKAWAKTGFVADISRFRAMGMVVAKDLIGLTSSAASVVRNSYDPIAVMQYAF